MHRRRVPFAFAGLFGFGPVPASADPQAAVKVRRIGYLALPTSESVAHIRAAFTRRLHELGWVEGLNLIIESRSAEGDVGRMPELATLQEAVPGASRIAILQNPVDRSALYLREVQAAACALHLRLQVVEASGPADFDRAFAAMTRERADALLLAGTATFMTHRDRLAALALQHRLPAMFNAREFVEAGGLMAYAVNQADFAGKAAVYVDKILRGAKAADMPIEQPTKFELILNLKTAKALGIKLPESILLRADQLIE